MKLYQTCSNKMMKTWQFRQFPASSTNTLICNRRKPIAAYRCLSFSYHRKHEIINLIPTQFCCQSCRKEFQWTAKMSIHHRSAKMMKEWELANKTLFAQNLVAGTDMPQSSVAQTNIHHKSDKEWSVSSQRSADRQQEQIKPNHQLMDGAARSNQTNFKIKPTLKSKLFPTVLSCKILQRQQTSVFNAWFTWWTSLIFNNLW